MQRRTHFQVQLLLLLLLANTSKRGNQSGVDDQAVFTEASVNRGGPQWGVFESAPGVRS